VYESYKDLLAQRLLPCADYQEGFTFRGKIVGKKQAKINIKKFLLTPLILSDE